MEPVVIVIALALLEYMYFAFQVGGSRAKYNVPAPKISGNEVWERMFRVHQNTLEQLIIFLPSIWFFGTYVSAPIAAGLGLVFVAGRFVYFRGYVADPEKRGPGMIMTSGSNVILLLGSIVGAAMALA